MQKTVGRTALFLVVTAVVIGTSFYWNQDGESLRNERPADESSDAVKSYDWSNWDLPSPARLNVSSRPDAMNFPGDHELVLPGVVEFVGGQPEPVTLELHVQGVDTRAQDPPGNDLQSRRSNLSPIAGQGPIPREETFKTTIRTDSSGRFRLDNAPTGLYRATLADSDWTGGRGTPQLITPRDTGPITVRARRFAKLIGTVTDGSGTPLSQASLRHSGSSSIHHTTESGSFAIERIRPNSTQTITVGESGFASKTITLSGIDPGEIRRRNIQLNRTGGLEVTVRSGSGGSIDTGNLRLTRVEQPDDENERYRTVAEVPLPRDGRNSFSDLRPGRYVVDYVGPQYFSEAKGLNVDAGETRTVTLRPRRMESVKIGVIDESTGRPLPFLVPELTAFDDDGNRLEPGFFLRDLTGAGLLSGYVHPEMRRARAVIEHSRITNSPRTFTFNRTDLPTVEFSVSTRPTNGSSQPATLKLQLTDYPEDQQITGFQLFVVNRETRQLALARGGNPDVLKQPLSLPAGRYYLYGLVNFESTSPDVFYRTINLPPGKSVTQRLRPSGPATITGTLDRPDRTNRLGVVPEPIQSQNSSDSSPYFPGPLQTTVNPNGDFKLKLVPPGVGLNLLVLGPETDSDTESDRPLMDRSVRPLGRNETHSLRTLNLPR